MRKKMEKQRVDQLTGPSLFNNKWSNTKWSSEDYYRGPEVMNAKQYSQRSVPKKAASPPGGNSRIKNQMKDEHRPESNQAKRTHRNSSGSSTPNPSKKSIDHYSHGFGFMTNQSNEIQASTSSNYVKNQKSIGKRQQRQSKTEISLNTHNRTWPRCQFCNNECYFYFNEHTQEQAIFCDCSLRKNFSAKETNTNQWKKNYFMWATNYYFIMEATYSFNVPNYENAIVTPPPERKWFSIGDFDESQQLATLNVMSYNILSDKCLSSNLYAYCPSWALRWDYRKNLIMQQIKQHQPDVLALQEVETWQYWSLFKPKMEALGYTGLFSSKSRAKTMNDNEKQSVDGCALFWKDDKFELYKDHVIEFTQLAIAKAEGSEHMLNRVMTRDNIALVAVLKIRPEIAEQENGEKLAGYDELIGKPLIACTTHIHWDPEFCDVKLIQTMMLVQELNEILERTANEYGILSERVPLLLCGDLNSTEGSGVLDYLTTGCIEAEHDDFKDFRGQACLKKLSTDPSSSSFYSHDLQLRSAYDSGILPFTNYTHDFKGVIDYIFASPNLIRKAVLGPLDNSWIRKHHMTAFPCSQIPSDHIPLLVQYGINRPMTEDQHFIRDTILNCDD